MNSATIINPGTVADLTPAWSVAGDGVTRFIQSALSDGKVAREEHLHAGFSEQS